MDGFVILNVNNVVWGREAFATEALAEAELRHFFKRDLKREKFSIVPIEPRHGPLPVLNAITGDYAGMVADAVTRRPSEIAPAPMSETAAASDMTANKEGEVQP